MANPTTTPAENPVSSLTPKQLAMLGEMTIIGPVFVAEYRSEGQETIKFTNKKTGLKEEFEKHSMGLEFGDPKAIKQMMCDIDYPKDVAPVPTGYTKGQKIVVVLSGMMETRGQYTASCSRHFPLV